MHKSLLGHQFNLLAFIPNFIIHTFQFVVQTVDLLGFVSYSYLGIVKAAKWVVNIFSCAVHGWLFHQIIQ